METSILISTKKILGISEEYLAFDQDVITHINAAFSTLHQIGLGPAEGFGIEDETAEWSDYIDDDISQLNAVKTYIYLRVRLIFDPPTISYVITAMEKQLEELEWRLSVTREDFDWIDPTPVRDTTTIIDGGPAQRLGIGTQLERRD